MNVYQQRDELLQAVKSLTTKGETQESGERWNVRLKKARDLASTIESLKNNAEVNSDSSNRVLDYAPYAMMACAIELYGRHGASMIEPDVVAAHAMNLAKAMARAEAE